MLPLYGFIQGDTLGLLIVAYGHETVKQLADRTLAAASVRVRNNPAAQILFKGMLLNSDMTLEDAKITALDKYEVVFGSEI